MSTVREGGCACGLVRYRLADAPLITHCCHCRNCQRQTGSAFAINLVIESDLVEILAGEPQPVAVPRDDGTAQRIYRCGGCQVAVFSEYGWPQLWYIRAGTLDEPSSIAPDVHIYTRSRLPWVQLPESIPSFDAYYDRNAVWPALSKRRFEAVRARRTMT